jgi:hypothetical protein
MCTCMIHVRTSTALLLSTETMHTIERCVTQVEAANRSLPCTSQHVLLHGTQTVHSNEHHVTLILYEKGYIADGLN